LTNKSLDAIITVLKNSFGDRMKIQFNRETMPDELYNVLLQHFVNEAVGLGVNVDKYTQFNNWIIECNVEAKSPVH
jgi:hypothetical protein